MSFPPIRLWSFLLNGLSEFHPLYKSDNRLGHFASAKYIYIYTYLLSRFISEIQRGVQILDIGRILSSK